MGGWLGLRRRWRPEAPVWCHEAWVPRWRPPGPGGEWPGRRACLLVPRSGSPLMGLAPGGLASRGLVTAVLCGHGHHHLHRLHHHPHLHHLQRHLLHWHRVQPGGPRSRLGVDLVPRWCCQARASLPPGACCCGPAAGAGAAGAVRSGVALDALSGRGPAKPGWPPPSCGGGRPERALGIQVDGAAAGPSMVRALPRVGARLARWCRWALVRRTGRWRALGRRRGTLRGPALLAPWFPPSF